MIKVDIVDNKFEITASEMERDLVMRINGLTATSGRTWTAPLRWALWVDIASTVLKYKGEVSLAAKEWGNREGDRVKALVARKYNDEGVESHSLGEETLFPGQVVDGKWLLEYDAGSGFLFSQMRTGKTLTICEAINNMEVMSVETSEPFLSPFPVLFVCPPGTTFEAKKAFKKAFPNRSLGVLENDLTPLQRKKIIEAKPDILIMGYNLLAKHTKLSYFGGIKADKRKKEVTQGLYELKELNAIEWRTVVADEAHNIKDPKSQQTRGWWYLGDRAAHRLATTGTPTSKEITDNTDLTKSRIDISDLWALLRAIYPLDFPAKSKFYDKYLWLDTNFFGILEIKGLHPENQKYWDMIFEPMYLRRLRNINTVKDERERGVRLTKKQRALYDQLSAQYMGEVDGELLVAPDSMTLRHRLREICAGTPMIENGQVVSLVEPSSKLDSMLEWLDESSDKAIIFVSSKPAFNMIEDKFLEIGLNYVAFPGGLNDAQKTQVTDSFREDPAVKVILCSIKAANAGIDMSAGKRLMFFTLSDDPIEMQQASDRGLGPTQTIDVFEVVYLVAEDTIEEDIYEALKNKELNLRTLLNDKEWLTQRRKK